MLPTNAKPGNHDPDASNDFLRECAKFSEVAREQFYRLNPSQRPRCPKADAAWFAKLRGEPLVELLDDHEQERILKTIVEDDEFRRATLVALRGRA